MTSKLTTQNALPERLAQFPDFPPRDDMQNILHLHQPSYLISLARHLGSRETTLVFAEMPVYWYPTRYARIPDLLVSFGVDPTAAIALNGYSIEQHGKPPDFVLEVASPTTARNDYTGKREDYAAFGIPEYWRFDPTEGRRYDTPLSGDRLIDGAYQPLEIRGSVGTGIWGRSEILGLDICWEDGKLRWWNPATRAYLETHDEVADARLAEREAYLAEREARLAAEARIRELESRLGNSQ